MNSDIEILPGDFDSLSSLHSLPDSGLKWDLVFTLPEWLKVWWQNFGRDARLYIRIFKQKDKIAGIAPLQIKEGTASIIGSIDVCDYQDFIVAPGSEESFYNAVLDDLIAQGVNLLHLETVRPDSSIVNHLMPLARRRGLPVEYKQTDVSFEMPLPSTWEDYLEGLDGKQRHEIKRKMRNLQDIGETGYQTISDSTAIPQAAETFLHMFPEYRGDKARFMTAEMTAFFSSLSQALAGTGILRFGELISGSKPVAMIMYFDYNNNIYLYNSAYDPVFKSMSVGVVSKARCIQESVAQGRKLFDFMKGPETYKAYLGGKEIPLYSCRIGLK